MLHSFDLSNHATNMASPSTCQNISTYRIHDTKDREIIQLKCQLFGRDNLIRQFADGLKEERKKFEDMKKYAIVLEGKNETLSYTLQTRTSPLPEPKHLEEDTQVLEQNSRLRRDNIQLVQR